MSALGQKQTFALQNVMSALPPIATSIAYFGMSAVGRYKTLPNAFFAYAARSTRVSISLRSAPKSMGLVKSASAPASNALRLVSTSP
jgi:hypothetical protein